MPWLLVSEPGHLREGRFVRGSDLGMAIAPKLRHKNDDPIFVMGADGHAASRTSPAAPRHWSHLTPASNSTVRAGRSANGLHAAAKANATQWKFAQYAADCGVPADTIVAPSPTNSPVTYAAPR